MSRLAASSDTVVVKASNNVYTALAVIGTVVALAGVVIVFLRAQALFPGKGLM